MSYEINGPYHYSYDLWPCFRIETAERLIGAIYIIDEPEEVVYERAKRMAEAAIDPAPETEGEG